LTIESGKCYGDGLKEDVPINPKTGLSTNIGSKVLHENGTSEQKEIACCFYLKLKSLDIFL
jgi:hypothetical protein